MEERPGKVVSTSEEVLRRTRRPVYVPKKIDKAVFSAVEALWGWGKPVYVRERPDNAILTCEEMQRSTCRPV